MLPWDDNGASGGWANLTDEAVIKELGDAVISFTGSEHGSPVECNYAQYIQIGGIVWTGELGSDPACEQAVVYTAEIDGKTMRLNDYVATDSPEIPGRFRKHSHPISDHLQGNQWPWGKLLVERPEIFRQHAGHQRLCNGTWIWLSIL